MFFVSIFRIGLDIVCDAIIISFITDDMIMIASLSCECNIMFVCVFGNANFESADNRS